MKILHVSAECYPAAKVGGLGDVVGALPIYLQNENLATSVIIPKYQQKWIIEQKCTPVFSSMVRVHDVYVPFSIEKVENDNLGFTLYVSSIPGLYDRQGIYVEFDSGYGYSDEVERVLCFQQSVLKWVISLEQKPGVIHCHDHHTGLIPFMMKHCPDYNSLSNIPTVFTIHNGLYQGAFSWNKIHLLPYFNQNAKGLLEWDKLINPMASAIRCSWAYTTVSKGYMKEIMESAMGLESLFRAEAGKGMGIINGIDANAWNPKTDSYLDIKLTKDYKEFKAKNKESICKEFRLNPELPLITFIGRLVYEKGADLLPSSMGTYLSMGGNSSFFVLGSGDSDIKDRLLQVKHRFVNFFDASITYNEKLSHRLYAASDFLVMPSRVEPCGLNQMYSMRYGTIPIVRATGGLKDTVPDFGEPNGNGISFNNPTNDDLIISYSRAIQLFHNPKERWKLVDHITNLDFSWQKAVKNYISIYKHLNPKEIDA